VYDAQARKSSARISTVSVPSPDVRHARVSSVVIVRRAEQVAAADRDEANPLYVGDLLLYPDVGVATRRSQDKELAFYFATYGARPRDTSGRIELLSHGRVVSSAPLVVSQVDAQGRFPQLQRMPIDTLPSGLYELRVTVADRAGSDSQTAKFRIVAESASR
jgi:hypothetical protein